MSVQNTATGGLLAGFRSFSVFTISKFGVVIIYEFYFFAQLNAIVT